MKRITLIVVILALATMACSITRATSEAPAAPQASTAVISALPTETALQPVQTILEPVSQLVPAKPSQVDLGVIYFTDFDKNDADWDEFSTENSQIAIGDSRLTIEVHRTMWETWTNPKAKPVDQPVVLETTAQLLYGAEDADYGFVCSYSGSQNYYTLAAHDDGTATIHRRKDGVPTLIAEATDLPIHKGGENHLRASCLDGFLQLEVNGILAVEVSDSELPLGSVGLLAGAYDEANIKIAYDWFAILSYQNYPSWDEEIRPVDLLYKTSFEHNDMAWQEGRGSFGDAFFREGKLEISTSNTSWVTWSIPQNLIIDTPVFIEVEAQGAEGSSYGVICGFQDADNYYGVLTDNYYAQIFQTSHGDSQTLDHVWISPTKRSDLNRLRVMCMEDKIRMDLNYEPILEVPVDLTPGAAGLVARSEYIPDTKVAFDNFSVSTAEEISRGNWDNYPEFWTYSTGFDNNDLNWDEGDWDSANLHIKDGRYQIKVNNDEWEVWALPHGLEVNSHVLVDVDAQRDFGPLDGGYGVVCSYQDSDNYYALVIDDEGYAEIYRWLNEKYEILAHSAEAPVNMGSSNFLSASCLPDRLSLEVNGQLVLDLEHDEAPLGMVGLLVRTPSEGGLQISFDNFNVTQETYQE